MSAVVGPGSLARGWTILSPVMIWIVLAAAGYQYGRIRLRRRYPHSPLLRPGRTIAFWSGLATIMVALVSPLDAWAEELFAYHMTQHLLLGLAAPLLFVLGRPLQVASFGLRNPTRRMILRDLHRLRIRLRVPGPLLALGAVGVHVLVFSIWHVPTLYDRAVASSQLHIFEHLTMFLSGLALWWAVVAVGWRDRSASAILYLFLAGLPMGALAALLTFAPSPLYTSHLSSASRFGLTPLTDQQLAGAIMWVPGGTVYLALGVILFVRWLGAGPEPGTSNWDRRQVGHEVA